jgi:hypothetical protein
MSTVPPVRVRCEKALTGMPDETRCTLFVSYSKADVAWRDMFLRHLRESFAHDLLWVDRESIDAGADGGESIKQAARRAKCALLLLTPAYLDCDHFARKDELPMLLDEQRRGLELLPVLVEPCNWEQVLGRPGPQLVGWPGDELLPGEAGPRADKRAVSEAGMESGVARETDAARNRAVLAVCDVVSNKFGVSRRLSVRQHVALPGQTERAFEGHGRLTVEDEPSYSGEFAMVYRGRLNGEPVAVKVVPTDAWRDRVERAWDTAIAAKKNLRDGTFIRMEQIVSSPEVHAVAMEYVDSPTLHEKLADYPGRRLPPSIVAPLLQKLAKAQSEAHEREVQIGALSTRSVYVDGSWNVRLTPFRIEAHLARGLTLGTDQLVNWDVLTMLTPEVYEGHQPVSKQEMDAHGQYYLGMLGLELLLGRRPVEITCFKDLAEKAVFFDDPRAFFDDGSDEGSDEGSDDGADRWTDQCPALAFVLARMLARRPGDRLGSADEVSEEMRLIGKGRLPEVLQRCLDDDYADGAMGPDFTARFYKRLFDLRPSLRTKFSKPAGQATHLAKAVLDLVEFDPNRRADRFLDHVDAHRQIGVMPEDAHAFRSAFVEEVVATGGRPAQGISAQTRGDAWNAVLKMGIDVMLRRVESATAAALT